jgi:hypothetical protein
MSLLDLNPVEEVDLEQVDKTLGLDTLKAAMPKGRRHIITQSLTDKINGIIDDPEVRDAFRDNLLGFSEVLVDPKITMTAYIQAVRYCSYKLMGFKDLESYIRTFPDRYERMLDDGKSIEHIRAIVSQYNGGKACQRILEQTLMPTHVLNYDIYQKAINTQATIMLDPTVSAMVRSNAANSLMITLKQPETANVKVEIGVKDDDSLIALKEVTMALVEQQSKLIKSGGASTKLIAESSIIPGVVERIEND